MNVYMLSPSGGFINLETAHWDHPHTLRGAVLVVLVICLTTNIRVRMRSLARYHSTPSSALNWDVQRTASVSSNPLVQPFVARHRSSLRRCCALLEGSCCQLVSARDWLAGCGVP